MVGARAIIASTIVGLVTISVYLCLALQFFFHRNPIALFQWDASNAMGPSAFNGGWPAAAFGLLLDIPVTLAWAALYVEIARRNAAVVKHPTLSGATYGGFVLAVMFGIIVPLGRAAQPAMSMSGPNFWNTLIAHVLFFGVPVAWTVTRVMQRGEVRVNVTTEARSAL